MTPTRTLSRTDAEPAVLRAPRTGDGAPLWRIAVESGVLDANSSYAYLLWCRDFRTTSVVAEIDAEVTGFVTGYRRPQAPHTLFVWQVAVDRGARGRGLAGAMLDHLVGTLAGQGVSTLETTVSPDNEASLAMFAALARRHDTELEREQLFTPPDFPDGHEAEDLYRIALQSAAHTEEEIIDDHR
ncbi:diaminobutyrate acetyltransferase [Nocardia sp. alder85J]|uniref:diaminobutyrate acetyltransferase n=1 Tax=Nocardia sp. alder85J TaxID=2862949 RepID=UPI001CD26DF5|nr:diaminobutyrate acetyltransferase [Nocardia sp. alder85J]MCX4094058.1 diaminobutyrate acetyltransferase [Nocardia sp. alder85J]